MVLHLHTVMAGMHKTEEEKECDKVKTKVIAYEGEPLEIVLFCFRTCL